jgi:hypothetical protein
MSRLFMRLQGRGDHDITRLAIALVILASAIGNAHAQTASDILAEADRLAWLKNWSRAEPLFSRAAEMFAAAGDERNALYARISAIRGRLPQLRLIEVSQILSDYLDNPIVQNDPKLRLRCLVVKGDVDMDFDDGLARGLDRGLGACEIAEGSGLGSTRNG